MVKLPVETLKKVETTDHLVDSVGCGYRNKLSYGDFFTTEEPKQAVNREKNIKLG